MNLTEFLSHTLHDAWQLRSCSSDLISASAKLSELWVSQTSGTQNKEEPVWFWRGAHTAAKLLIVWVSHQHANKRFMSPNIIIKFNSGCCFNSPSVDNTSTFNAFTFLASTLDHNYMVSNKDVNVKADVVLAGIVDYFRRRINTHDEYMSLVSFYNSRTVFRVKSNINYNANIVFWTTVKVWGTEALSTQIILVYQDQFVVGLLHFFLLTIRKTQNMTNLILWRHSSKQTPVTENKQQLAQLVIEIPAGCF